MLRKFSRSGLAVLLSTAAAAGSVPVISNAASLSGDAYVPTVAPTATETTTATVVNSVTTNVVVNGGNVGASSSGSSAVAQGSLPFTGMDLTVLIAIGAGLLLLGIVLFMSARRKQSAA